MSESLKQFYEFRQSLINDAFVTWDDANQEYSTDDAWTSNFDYAALLMRLRGHDIKPRDTAMVYLMKSIFSIAKGDSRRQSMRSRYIDAINYLLMMAHMDEHNHDIIMLDVERHYHYAGVDMASPHENDQAPPEPKPDNPFDQFAAELTHSDNPYLYKRQQEIINSTFQPELKLRSDYQKRWADMPRERQDRWESFREFIAHCAFETALEEHRKREANAKLTNA